MLDDQHRVLISERARQNALNFRTDIAVQIMMRKKPLARKMDQLIQKKLAQRTSYNTRYRSTLLSPAPCCAVESARISGSAVGTADASLHALVLTRWCAIRLGASWPRVLV